MTIVPDEWLALTIEKPIEPELPIIDTHHHIFGKLKLWREHPDRLYLPEDLMHDIDGNGIIKTVFIECQSMWRQHGPPEMRPVGETEYVHSVATQSATGKYGKTQIAAAIVGFVDFIIGRAVEPVLEAHIATSSEHFRGIRYVVAWDENLSSRSKMGPPKGLLSNPKFREGLASLQKYGLSFDVWLYFHQLIELADLARVFPEIQIIVDHTGGPINIGPYIGKREEVFQEWKRGIAALATCPNVAIKLGGLGLRTCGFGWHEQPTPPSSAELADAMSPYFLWCIEQFGVDRCMFESDFPVDKISYSYTIIWNAFKRITREFSESDRHCLFHDTAAKVYRLSSDQ